MKNGLFPLISTLINRINVYRIWVRSYLYPSWTISMIVAIKNNIEYPNQVAIYGFNAFTFNLNFYIMAPLLAK